MIEEQKTHKINDNVLYAYTRELPSEIYFQWTKSPPSYEGVGNFLDDIISKFQSSGYYDLDNTDPKSKITQPKLSDLDPNQRTKIVLTALAILAREQEMSNQLLASQNDLLVTKDNIEMNIGKLMNAVSEIKIKLEKAVIEGESKTVKSYKNNVEQQLSDTIAITDQLKANLSKLIYSKSEILKSNVMRKMMPQEIKSKYNALHHLQNYIKKHINNPTMSKVDLVALYQRAIKQCSQQMSLHNLFSPKHENLQKLLNNIPDILKKDILNNEIINSLPTKFKEKYESLQPQIPDTTSTLKK